MTTRAGPIRVGPAEPVGQIGEYPRRYPSPWLLMLPLGLALALLPPALTLSVAAGAGGALVLLSRPRWALYLLALTVPYQSLLDVRLYDVSVSVTEVVSALLVLGWTTWLAAGHAIRPPRSAVIMAMAALLATFALSALGATNLMLAAKEMLKWVELAAVYLAGVSLLETPAHRRTLLLWLVSASVSQALLGLTQSVTRWGPGHFMIGDVLMRAYGTFEQPNPFGGYLGLTLPVVVALALFGNQSKPWQRLVNVAAATIGLALLITLSRGAWIGQVVGLLLVVAAGSAAARRAVVTFGMLGTMLLAGLWTLLPAELSGRASSVVGTALDLGSLRDALVTPDNWAVLERRSQWFAGWQMFQDRPFLGVGIGNYNAVYDDYRLDQWPIALGHAHNHYLTVAAEAGLAGLLTYLAFLVTAFRSGRESFRLAPDPMGRALALGILGSLAAFATHSMFDVLFVHGMGVTLGLMLALLHGVPRGLAGAWSTPASLPDRSPLAVGGERRAHC